MQEYGAEIEGKGRIKENSLLSEEEKKYEYVAVSLIVTNHFNSFICMMTQTRYQVLQRKTFLHL